MNRWAVICGFLVTVHDPLAFFFHNPQRLKLFHGMPLGSLELFKSSYEKYFMARGNIHNMLSESPIQMDKCSVIPTLF